MQIGILSDTHGFLHSRLYTFFDGVDEIWHAGDIGNQEVIDGLEKIAPVVAVHGNIDDYPMRLKYPENIKLNRDGLKVYITHIAGASGKYHNEVNKKIKSYKPDIFVCGHSHILKIEYIEQQKHLYINPGAAGMNGFHRFLTAVRLEIIDGKPVKTDILEIPRG